MGGSAQLTVLVVSALGLLLAFGNIVASIFILRGSGPPAGIGLFFVGYFLVIVVQLVAAIFGIVAARAANRGELYRYPLAIPFVR